MPTAPPPVVRAARSASAVRAQARLFKALGHPARLRLVLLLADGERCVCDLTARVRLDISTVSRHLAVLIAAGVLRNERRANQIFYHLRTPCVLKILTCVGEVQCAPDGAGAVAETCCVPVAGRA